LNTEFTGMNAPSSTEQAERIERHAG